MRRSIRFVVGLLTWLATGAACGGSSAPTSPSSPTATTPRITIGADGVVTPRELVVSPGTRVLFVNEHSRPHDMSSDLHPDHLECPPINQAGYLSPGQQRETGNLVAVRTCGFHDHDNPTDGRLQGRIIIR